MMGAVGLAIWRLGAAVPVMTADRRGLAEASGRRAGRSDRGSLGFALERNPCCGNHCPGITVPASGTKAPDTRREGL